MNINTIMITETLNSEFQYVITVETVFQCILTGCFVKAEIMNIFPLKVQISLPAALSSSLISRSLKAEWKPFALSSIIRLLFGTKILSSKTAHIVQTATWTPRRAFLLFFIYFSSSQWQRLLSSAVGRQMKDSVCSNHSDICRCSEASHCLLRVSVHSRPSPQATSRPQLSDRSAGRTRRELFAGWNLLGGNRWRLGGSVDGGWDGGGRSAGPPRARQMMLLLEGKQAEPREKDFFF